MSRIRDKVSKEACKKVSLDYYLPVKVIEEIMYQYYKMIATDIKNASIEDPNSFLNFNLPKLGKLYVSQRKLKRKLENYDKSTD